MTTYQRNARNLTNMQELDFTQPVDAPAVAARGAMVDDSLTIFGAKSTKDKASTAKRSEPDYIDLPDPFIVTAKLTETAVPVQKPEEKKPEEKKEEKPKEEHHDWFHDACSFVSGAVDAVSGAVDIACQVTVGAVTKVCEAVVEHPWETAVMVAEGAAIGVVLVAAAPVVGALGAGAAVVAGVSLVSDAAIVGMTAAGAIKAGCDSLDAAQGSALSADILMHKSCHTEAEIEKARLDVQNKTGGAALEAVMTLTMSGPAWGSGVRIVSSEAKALGGAKAALSAGEASAAVSTAESSALAAKSATSDAAVARQQVEPTFKKDVAEPTKPVEVPPGVAPEMMKTIDQVLASRQEMVNLKALTRKLDEVIDESRSSINIKIDDPMTGPRRLTNAELRDIDGTRQLLQGKPQAQAYEEFLSKWEEINARKEQIEEELKIRRSLVSDVVNQYASKLFPDGVVPELKVVALKDANNATTAAYGNGKLFVRDADLIEPSYFRDPYKITDSLTHEINHGEQDGLMLRHFIDRATGGDTSGRPLTPDEILEIRRTALDETANKYSAEMVEDVNAKRAGDVLSPAEVERAEGLEASNRAQDDATPVHDWTRDQIDLMRDEIDLTNRRGMSPSFFTPKYQSSLWGDMEPPAQILDLLEQFEQLPKGRPGKYSLEEFDFADQSKDQILKVLHEELDRLKVLKKDNYEEYRGWQHEAEAWDVGAKAADDMFWNDVMQAFFPV